MITFGMRLKQLRESKNVSQQEFCNSFNALNKEMKITRQSLGNWEREERFPDESTIKELARYFDVSIGYMMGDSEGTKNNNIGRYYYFYKMLEEMEKRGDITKDKVSEEDIKLLVQLFQKDIRINEEKK